MTQRKFRPFFLTTLAWVFFCTGCKPPQREIHFLAWTHPQNNSTLKNQVQEFMRRNPDIIIQLTLSKSEEELKNQIENMTVSNQLPDVMILPDSLARDLDEKNLLQRIPIENYTDSQKIAPELIDCFRNQDSLIAIPLDWSVEVLFYNQTLFEKQAFRVPGEYWDWSDLATATEALSFGSDDPETLSQWGFDFSAHPDHWIPFLFQNNGQIQNVSGKWVLSDPQYIQSNMEALEYYTQLFQNNHTLPSVMEHERFIQGKAAMTIASREFAKSLKNVPFTWNIAPLPRGRQAATLISAHGLAISRNSKYLDADIGLITFLASEITQTALTLGGTAPSLKELWTSRIFLEYPNSKPILNSVFATSLAFARPPFRNSPHEKAKKILTEEMKELIFNSDRTARETLETMQIRLEELQLTTPKTISK